MGITWGKWEGGRTRLNSDGSTTWFIRKTIGGKRWEFALDAKTPKEAGKELDRFEDDPTAYKTKDQRAADILAERAAEVAKEVRLDGTTIQGYLDATVGKLSHDHRLAAKRYLSTWAEKLKGTDLRKVTRAQVDAVLDSGSKKHLGMHLRAFCRWLAKEGTKVDGVRLYLDLAESPGRFVFLERAKGTTKPEDRSYSLETVEAWYRALEDQQLRDIFRIRVMHGLHYSEILRIAAGDHILRKVDRKDGIYGVVSFRHKRGDWHYTSLPRASYEALERLIETKDLLVRNAINEALDRTRAAAKANGTKLPDIHFANLRHTAGTWANRISKESWVIAEGGELERVSAFMGHTNTSVTRAHYLADYVPDMPALPFKLVHPEDPGVGGGKVLKLASR